MKRQFTKAPFCQLCEFTPLKQSSFLQRPLKRNLFSTRPSAWLQNPRVIVKPKLDTSKTDDSLRTRQDHTNEPTIKYATQYSQSQLEDQLHKATTGRDNLLSEGVPKEEDVLRVLKYCDVMADSLTQPAAPVVDNGKKSPSASNALLSLDEQTPKVGIKKVQATPQFVLSAIDQISSIASSIVEDSCINVTPGILNHYVRIQAKLGKPETFPEIFHLYANKPLPLEGTSPIRYKNQNPNKISNAIAKDTVDIALQSAIDARRLGIAINIIETTFATKAYRRMKTFQKALLPAVAAGLAPIALYTIASQFAELQSSMDNETATKVAFAGMLSYVGITSAVGFLAVSTSNDQMDRVTWAPGMPLRYRWLQEDERAAFDKIAGAWGFRELWRRGEEEGEEWEILRECIGMKGMILDKTSLLQGMVEIAADLAVLGILDYLVGFASLPSGLFMETFFVGFAQPGADPLKWLRSD